MKLSLISLAKVYIVFFGIIHFDHVVSLLGINETMVSAPPYLSFWWWHVILFLVYVVLPLLAVLIDNYTFYVIITGVSSAGILVQVFKVFTWNTDLYFVLVPLYAIAAVLSLALAVENVASKVSAETLSLGWSQF